MEYYRKIKSFLKKILLLNDTAPGIALGFAVGLFLSVIPTFGLGMVVALVLAPFIRANLISTYLGTLIVNPFTAVFFYSLDYLVGSWLVGGESSIEIPGSLTELIGLVGTIGWPLYLGGVIVAAVLSFLAYGGIFWATRSYQKKKNRSRTGI